MPRKPKSPRVRATEGDVFQLSIDVDRVGYGQVVGSRPSTLLVAIFRESLPRTSVCDCAQIVTGDVAFLAETFDAKIWNGDWPIVGHVVPDHVRIPFPWYKVTIDRATDWYVESYDTSQRRPAMPWEVDSLLLRNIVSPIRLEKALQALHGIGQWDPSYRLMEFDVMRRSSEDVATQPIYVSLVVGGLGSENLTAVAAARAIGQLADEAGNHIKPSGLSVVLTFHIGGSILSPDYHGVRTGRYIPKNELLDVQAAVPVPLSADEARGYITGVLHEISRLVHQYVARRRLKVATAAFDAALGEMLEKVPALQLSAHMHY